MEALFSSRINPIIRKHCYSTDVNLVLDLINTQVKKALSQIFYSVRSKSKKRKNFVSAPTSSLPPNLLSTVLNNTLDQPDFTKDLMNIPDILAPANDSDSLMYENDPFVFVNDFICLTNTKDTPDFINDSHYLMKENNTLDPANDSSYSMEPDFTNDSHHLINENNTSAPIKHSDYIMNKNDTFDPANNSVYKMNENDASDPVNNFDPLDPNSLITYSSDYLMDYSSDTDCNSKWNNDPNYNYEHIKNINLSYIKNNVNTEFADLYGCAINSFPTNWVDSMNIIMNDKTEFNITLSLHWLVSIYHRFDSVNLSSATNIIKTHLANTFPALSTDYFLDWYDSIVMEAILGPDHNFNSYLLLESYGLALIFISIPSIRNIDPDNPYEYTSSHSNSTRKLNYSDYYSEDDISY